MDDLLRKMWSMHTVNYYAAIKKNTIMIFAAMWMDLVIIIQSGQIQIQKDNYITSVIRGI